MKTYGGVEIYLHAFLNSALDGCEMSASRPDSFNPGVGFPATHLVGGWGWAPVPVWTLWWREKHPCLRRESNPGRAVHGLVAVLIDLSTGNGFRIKIRAGVSECTCYFFCYTFLLQSQNAIPKLGNPSVCLLCHSSGIEFWRVRFITVPLAE
jgi:hypothetical protein